ncbi:hypothetical protein D3C87_1741040 [compost metagenome]
MTLVTLRPAAQASMAGPQLAVHLFCGSILKTMLQLCLPNAREGSVSLARHLPSSVEYGARVGAYRTMVMGGKPTVASHAWMIGR